MHPRDLAVALWVFTILVSLGVLGVAWASARGQAAPVSPRATPDARLTSALLAAVALVAYAVAPTPLKGLHALAGLIVGGALGLSWAHVRHVLVAPADDAVKASLTGFAVALPLAVCADVWVSDPVLLSYGLFGAVLGFATVTLPMALSESPRTESLTLLLALLGGLAAAMVWGDRAALQHSVGTSRVLGFAALSLAVRYATLALPQAWASLAGGLLLASISLPLGLWWLRLDPRFLWAALAGVALAVALGGLVRLAARAEAARALADVGVALVAGGVLLLCNRLFGIHGVAIAGVGLTIFLADRGSAAAVAALLGSAFAGRALLQLFLDRTYLRQVGVDLTHPYTALGLVAALLVPFALQGLRRYFPVRGPLLALTSFFAIALPLGLGYFVHIEPLATYMTGLVLLGITFALARPEAGVPSLSALVPPLLLSAAPLSLLSAPWLIQVMNTPRATRIAVFVAVSILLLGYLLAVVRSRVEPTVAA